MVPDLDWTPLVRGGINIKTHQLVADGPFRWCFKRSLEARLLIWFLTLFPLLILGILFFENLKNPVNQEEVLVALLVTSVIILLNLYFRFSFGQTIVFDKHAGFFRKGKRDKHPMKLNEIDALQIISKYIWAPSSRAASYHSHELNLVLKNGKRRAVINHGDLAAIQNEATALASFLKVPVLKG